MDTEFNLQTFLTGMRDEANEKHAELSVKIDTIRDTLNEHHTRITVVENTRKILIWVSGAVVVGLIGFVFDLLR